MQHGFEDFQDVIGQRERLSGLDIEDVVDVYGPGQAIFVDASANSKSGAGTLANPYPTIQEGMANAPAGATIWIRGGLYTAPDTYSKPSTWQSYSGAVTIEIE